MDHSLGDELRHLRTKRRLSMEELAALSGVSRNTIQKIETGAQSALPSTLMLLAQGLTRDEPGGRHDPVLSEQSYERLSRAAAGLDPDRHAAGGDADISREDMAATLGQKLGPDLAFAMSDVLWNFNRIGIHQRRLLEAAAFALADDLENEGNKPNGPR